MALKTASGGDPTDLTGFGFRETSVHVGSERLELAEVPLPPTIEAGETTLDLDRLVLGLAVGQPVAVSGDRQDLAGIRGTEIVTLVLDRARRRPDQPHVLALQHPYVRRTTVLNANVVRASHGETVTRRSWAAAPAVLTSASACAARRSRT